MNALRKYRYSFVAGACAAGGSFFGKLPSFLDALNLLQPNAMKSVAGFAYVEFALVQLLPLGLMLCCNVCNLRYFLKALQMTQQTLTATVLAAASNYVLSFILGTIVYREPLTALSGVGITLILAGLWFLCDTTDSRRASVGQRTVAKHKEI
ncbi:uncharacterized protein [Drosophila virilis]|uniref:Uncharacterized protein, isoform B n=1 Tax=Drosophila virilis TaxID=7244 RepID=A0A0Q9WW78_DROVI|nr:uncharacterized protein LOC26530925 isoform X1 [Drosophila virilis]KRF85230.1 uncharacterized protein Dvir_GJ26155, isoform B [Drosophila virilis]